MKTVTSRFMLMVGASSFLVACAQIPAPVRDGYAHGRPSSVKSTPRVAQRIAPTVTPKALNADEALAPLPTQPSMTTSQLAEPAYVPEQPLEEPLEDGEQMIQYQVKATDTGFKLAREYQTSVERILKDNGLTSVAEIREGQTLRIACNSKPAGSAWDDMKRVLTAQRPVPTKLAAPVQTAEAKLPVSSSVRSTPQAVVAVATPKAEPKIEPRVAAAALANPKLAAIEPAAGERPAKSDEGVTFESYTVQPKETIYRISLKYNVSVLDIMAANDFDEPQDLKANAVIKVPVKKTITQQIAAKVAAPIAQVAPAAGDDMANKTPVVVEQAGKPIQVAMLSKAPIGAEEAQTEDLDSKAVKQQAVKDAVLPTPKEKPVSKDEAREAEEKRGMVDRAAANSKGLVWPVKGQIVRRFGDDGSGVARTGINIAVPKNTPVLASEAGTVLYADDGLKIYGKMVLVRHDNGMVSAYAHNGYLLVKKNERVKKGQVIALSGATGNVESPQLHFELRQHASAIDPIAMLPRL